MITVQMAELTRTDVQATIAVEADTKSAQVELIIPLSGTKVSEPRPKINGRDRTDVMMEMIDRIEPSNKRQYAV